MKKQKSPHSPRCNLICHFRRAKHSQEKQKLSCRLECLNDSVQLPVCSTEPFPLLITDRQGLIEIHISRLQLFTSIARIPEEEDICNLQVYISWDIWGERTAYTPRMKCPNLAFNSSSVYRIANLHSFFKNVLSEYLIFRVNVVRPNDTTCVLARAKVSIKDILDYPQNKLHYIVPVNSVDSCFSDVNFGQLSLWVRLSCNVDMVEAFKKRCGITSRRDALVPSMERDAIASKAPDEEESPTPEDSNGQHIQSTLDSNFQNETENSEDENFYNSDEGFFSPVNDMTEASEDENEMVSIRRPGFEADDSITKTENDPQRNSSSMEEFRSPLANGVLLFEESSSTIRDIGEVLSEKNWEWYRQRSLTFASTIRAKSLSVEKQAYRHDTSTCQVQKDTITVEIVSMQFLDESFVMQDDEIHLLYIEYSFLGHFGKNMETVSIEKTNQEMIYNFKKNFWIDEETHSLERNSLRSMLSESISPNIKFIVISEPLPEETEVKECEEVGYAIFNIKKYAVDHDHKNISLPIKDNRNKLIGVLKIAVSGFDAIRQCYSEVETNHS